MTVTKVRRLVNPAKRRNASAKKRKLSPKQIKIFGTKAQKAALKRKRTMSRTRPAAKPRKTAHRRKTNPASIITLMPAALNPRKRGKTVATKTRKRRRVAAGTAPRRRRVSHRRRSVATAVNPRRRRRTRTASNPRRRRVNSHRRRNGTKIYVMRKNRGGRRRNPISTFGLSGAKMGEAILAGLVGVYTTKTFGPTITTYVATAAPSIASGSMGSIVSAVISGAIAWGGGMLVSKWSPTAGQGFMFGGLMQAFSQLLNLVVPANPLSLSGMGDFVPGRFTVPQNPIMAARMMQQLPAPMPAQGSNLSGMMAAASFK